MAYETVQVKKVTGGCGAEVLGVDLKSLSNRQWDEIQHAFTEHGDPAKLLAQMGLDAAGIEASIRARFADLMERARHPAVYELSKRRAA